MSIRSKAHALAKRLKHKLSLRTQTGRASKTSRRHGAICEPLESRMLLSTVTVTGTADLIDGDTSSIAALIAAPGNDGEITLREAVQAANNTVGEDVIGFASQLYRLPLELNTTLDVTESLSILGFGANDLLLSTPGLQTLFNVDLSAEEDGLFVLAGMTVLGDTDYGIEVTGGTLLLENVIFEGDSEADPFNTATLIADTITIGDIAGRNINLDLQSTGAVTLNSIFNPSGDITITADTVTATSILSTSGITEAADAGDIRIVTQGDITLNDLHANGAAGIDAGGNGGEIYLEVVGYNGNILLTGGLLTGDGGQSVNGIGSNGGAITIASALTLTMDTTFSCTNGEMSFSDILSGGSSINFSVVSQGIESLIGEQATYDLVTSASTYQVTGLANHVPISMFNEQNIGSGVTLDSGSSSSGISLDVGDGSSDPGYGGTITGDTGSSSGSGDQGTSTTTPSRGRGRGASSGGASRGAGSTNSNSGSTNDSPSDSSGDSTDQQDDSPTTGNTNPVSPEDIQFNTAPVADDVTGIVYEDGQPITLALSASDVDGDAVIFQFLTLLDEGELVYNGDGTFTYTPGSWDQIAAGMAQNVALSYRAIDSYGTASAPATITLTVVGNNEVIPQGNVAPTAAPNFVRTDSQTAIDINVLANDHTPDGDYLLTSNVDATSTLGIALTVNADGTIAYDPTQVLANLEVGQRVRDSFTYTVSDPFGNSDTAMVFVDVTGVKVPEVTVASQPTGQRLMTLAAVEPKRVNETAQISPINQITGIASSLTQHFGLQGISWSRFGASATDTLTLYHSESAYDLTKWIVDHFDADQPMATFRKGDMYFAFATNATSSTHTVATLSGSITGGGTLEKIGLGAVTLSVVHED